MERHHYDLVPYPGLAVPPADCPLRLESLAGPEDPRLEPVVREVLVGSLDMADRTFAARVGLERAARETVCYLLASDPWQCLRLAYDDGPESVGLVFWTGEPGGSGYVLLVGWATGTGAAVTASGCSSSPRARSSRPAAAASWPTSTSRTRPWRPPSRGSAGRLPSSASTCCRASCS